MHQLTEEILASREWRIRELEALKKIGIIALNGPMSRFSTS